MLIPSILFTQKNPILFVAPESTDIAQIVFHRKLFQQINLSAGQYFDIKIDYVDITEDEFNTRIANYKKTFTELFEESHKLEEEIMRQLNSLKLDS